MHIAHADWVQINSRTDTLYYDNQNNLDSPKNKQFSPPKKIKNNYKIDIMQLFSADATIFSKKIKIFFAHKKLKKKPSKVAQKNSNPLFFLTTPLSCPSCPNRRIHVPKCSL